MAHKLAKDYAQYGRAKPGGDRCDECRWFVAGQSCEIVDGQIGAGMWCRFHHERARRQPMRDVSADREMIRSMRARHAG